MKKTITYVRCAHVPKGGASYQLARQKLDIREYAQEHGMEIDRVYSDKGGSGLSLERPALQQMLEDAEQGGFDIVLVTLPDRFSRSITDWLEIHSFLERLGIEVVYVKNAGKSAALPGVD